MASSTDVRYIRYLRRAVFWALTAGAAALLGMLFNAAEASAQPVTIPGIGTFEVSDEVPLPDAPEKLFRNNAILPVTEAPVTAGIPEIETAAATPVSHIEIAPATLGPAVEFPVSVVVPAIELPVPTIIPAIEIPLLGALPEIELPFLAEFPDIMPRAPTPPAAVIPQKSAGEMAVDAARTKLGSDYSYGAVGPDSFDCSGLVQWSYEQAGVELPRTSYDQLATGTPVPLDDLQPGDVVSFYGGSHSALYAGEGKVIHASTYGVGVTTSPLSSMPVSGARRF
ncbi:C40 family peptidase [Nocardia sp. NPDC047654]|uniref:C40 family peptidase n=1 Tax=Nocardia sp. NPDC047654 TaxID=3364314 RepID=UPI00371EDDD9